MTAYRITIRRAGHPDIARTALARNGLRALVDALRELPATEPAGAVRASARPIPRRTA